VTTVTPRLVLDEALLDANIEQMATKVRERGAALRPHVKTHKCPEIMRRQLRAGAVGVTVATVREAVSMVDAGASDVLIAYPPVGEFRLAAIRALTDRARIVVACSEPAHVRALAGLGVELEYYWEVECGTQRLGTAPGAPTADALAAIAGLGGTRLAGLMGFSGHAYTRAGGEAMDAVTAGEQDALAATAEQLRARGLDPGVISVGSTPLQDHPNDFATEYRFGNYVFYDATQVALGTVPLERCALRVQSRVIGLPAQDRIVLDAGSKALAAERMSAETPSFGLVVGHPELRIGQLYEEHAICTATAPHSLRLDDLVEIVPNHACTCANLHREYVLRTAGGAETAWPITASGW
jgi:D-serine deaminase-like pyridoxal phosphate-dependent protein